MRDLFQVVFELKKKEIDEAKMQLGKEREVVRVSHGTNNERNVRDKAIRLTVITFVSDPAMSWQLQYRPIVSTLTVCTVLRAPA